MKYFVHSLIADPLKKSSSGTRGIPGIRVWKRRLKKNRKGMSVAKTHRIHVNMAPAILDSIRLKWGWYRMSFHIRREIIKYLDKCVIEVRESAATSVVLPSRGDLSRYLDVICMWFDCSRAEYLQKVLGKKKVAQYMSEEQRQYQLFARKECLSSSHLNRLRIADQVRLLRDLAKYEITVIFPPVTQRASAKVRRRA